MSWAEVKYLLDNSKGGGLVPNKLTSLVVTSSTMSWKATQTIIENQVVCDVGKIVFRYSKDVAPATPGDGTFLFETTELSGRHECTLDDGTWVSGFVYSDRGVLNSRPVSAQPVSVEGFAKDTWEVIQECSEAGEASGHYSVGDEKTVSIGGTDYTLVILDFGHDDLSDGSGKAGITIGLKNCLTTTRQMNSSNENSGGWTSCAMRSYLQSTVLGQLPSDLQAVIKKVDKKTSAGSKSSKIKTTSDNLFLLSEIEIFGATPCSYGGEGAQYPYFTTTSRRVKTLDDGGAATYWWERSPYASYSDRFCCVSSGGGAGSYGDSAASIASGVSFGFCI